MRVLYPYALLFNTHTSSRYKQAHRGGALPPSLVVIAPAPNRYIMQVLPATQAVILQNAKRIVRNYHLVTRFYLNPTWEHIVCVCSRSPSPSSVRKKVKTIVILIALDIKGSGLRIWQYNSQESGLARRLSLCVGQRTSSFNVATGRFILKPRMDSDVLVWFKIKFV